MRTLRRLNRVKRLPNRGRLEGLLPADLYAQFVAIRNTYAPGNDEIDRLTPLFAADALYKKALEESDLVASRDIYRTADRLARRSDAERVRIEVDEQIDGLTFLNDVQSIPMEEQIACLADVLSLLESHLGSLLTRAEIWADGDVSPLTTHAHPAIAQVCIETLQINEQISRVTQLVKAEWLNTADEALKAHGTTVAILDIAEIIEPTGLISELLNRGYDIEGPIRMPNSDASQ